MRILTSGPLEGWNHARLASHRCPDCRDEVSRGAVSNKVGKTLPSDDRASRLRPGSRLPSLISGSPLPREALEKTKRRVQ